MIKKGNLRLLERKAFFYFIRIMMRHYTMYYCTNLSNATWNARRKLEARLFERQALFLFHSYRDAAIYYSAMLSNASRRRKFEATLLE